jgi:hypothetical protein
VKYHCDDILPTKKFSQLFFAAVLSFTLADVSHIIVDGTTTTTTSYPPIPYAFSYEAGRAPGHVDREFRNDENKKFEFQIPYLSGL